MQMSHISPIELVSKEALVKIKSLAFNSETTDLDYKEIFKISDAKSKTEFIKDICAFANTKGGYLLYGINNDNEWIGLDERSDAKVDDADIANIIDDFVDGHIDCLVNTIEIDNRYFVVVYVFPSSSILPFKKDGQYNKKNWKTGKAEPVCAFKKGDVYCRRHSRSIKADNLFYTLKGNNFKIVENFLDGAPIYNEFIGRSDYLGELYKKYEPKITELFK